MKTHFVTSPSPACPSCHAATIVETTDGDLLAAWFGGTAEGHPDVDIWLARFDGQRWGPPAVVAGEPDVPLWNPVLFRDALGSLWLFYKVAPAIPAWTGAYIRSADGGRTWSPPIALPAGLLGPIKNKPIILANGDIICGTSSEAWRSWACWVEISPDGGRTWTKHGPITAPGEAPPPAGTGPLLPAHFRGAIQPAVWEYAPGRLRMLMRSTRAVGAVCMASSDDGGRTWSPARPTPIPNPNSGLDAVRLADGRVVLACNPSPDARTPLSLLISADNGETWPQRLDLETEPGEYSYPSLIQAGDGRVHVVYTYRRTHIRHMALAPASIGSE